MCVRGQQGPRLMTLPLSARISWRVWRIHPFNTQLYQISASISHNAATMSLLLIEKHEIMNVVILLIQEPPTVSYMPMGTSGNSANYPKFATSIRYILTHNVNSFIHLDVCNRRIKRRVSELPWFLGNNHISYVYELWTTLMREVQLNCENDLHPIYL